MDLDRRAYCLRKRVEHETGMYLASLSSATIVLQGHAHRAAAGRFFPDLTDQRFTSAIALAHSRFSTNTFPSWPLAHPFRLIAHNGEINTIRGNRNWMRAREAQLAYQPCSAGRDGRGIERLLPILDEADSDSASFDACLELLHLGGRSLPHAVLMMIPQAWENDRQMETDLQAFYRFHASLMEPWDGPALIAFTDGTLVGAVLDRNGLRPGRYWVTDDGLVVLASEVGVLDLDPARIVRKGRLQPGNIFLVDTAAGRIIEDEEVKAALAGEHPYDDWLHAGMLHLDGLPERHRELPDSQVLLTQQQLFGYTEEERRVLLAPMARTGAEPIGSMGDDTPAGRALGPAAAGLRLLQPAVRPGHEPAAGRDQGGARHLARPRDRARAQHVGPGTGLVPADRAAVSRSSATATWPRSFTSTTTGTCPDSPRTWSTAGTWWRAAARPCGTGWRRSDRGLAAIRRARRSSCCPIAARRWAAARSMPGLPALGRTAGHWPGGRRGRRARPPEGADPSLLLTGAVHHHLITERTRTRAGLVVESGDVRECHHIALLIGYGAAAVCPYLAIETGQELVRSRDAAASASRRPAANLIKALGKGVLKIMSKMGVSTVASYTGAQLFEAVGLGPRGDRRLLRRDVVPARRDRLRPDRGQRRCQARHRHAGRPAAPGWTGSTAATTSGAATASRTCSARRRCSGCSTRPGPGRRACSGSTPGWSTTSRPG